MKSHESHMPDDLLEILLKLDLKEYRIMQIVQYCAILVNEKKLNVSIYQAYKYSLVLLLMQIYPFSKRYARKKVALPPNK